VVERNDTPHLWGRQCSSTTTHSGAERQRQRNGEGGGAAAPAQWPGDSGAGSARRIDSDESRGTWSSGDTPPLGAGNARRRPPAVERNGSGKGAARAAGQRPQRSGPAGPAREQRRRLSPANRKRRQSGYGDGKAFIAEQIAATVVEEKDRGIRAGPTGSRGERRGTGRAPGRNPAAAPRGAERTLSWLGGEGTGDPSRAHEPERRSGEASFAPQPVH
jgi:hypothetical protein